MSITSERCASRRTATEWPLDEVRSISTGLRFLWWAEDGSQPHYKRRVNVNLTNCFSYMTERAAAPFRPSQHSVQVGCDMRRTAIVWRTSQDAHHNRRTVDPAAASRRLCQRSQNRRHRAGEDGGKGRRLVDAEQNGRATWRER